MWSKLDFHLSQETYWPSCRSYKDIQIKQQPRCQRNSNSWDLSKSANKSTIFSLRKIDFWTSALLSNSRDSKVEIATSLECSQTPMKYPTKPLLFIIWDYPHLLVKGICPAHLTTFQYSAMRQSNHWKNNRILGDLLRLGISVA